MCVTADDMIGSSFMNAEKAELCHDPLGSIDCSVWQEEDYYVFG